MRVGLKDLFTKPRRDEDEQPVGREPAANPAELDRMLIEELQRFGADLGQPRDTRFFLYFDDQADAENAAEAIAAEGYDADVEQTEPDRPEPWRVVAWRDMVVDDEAIADARRVFGRIAVAHWGSFGGWEAAATD